MRTWSRFLCLSLLASSLKAQPLVEFEGSVQKYLPNSQRHAIKLLKINFSPIAHEKILKRLDKLENKSIQAAQANKAFEGSSVDLGMNDVPVLNQGTHGSCVTFALTAALDAVIGKGDYVSQLCLLTLGQHLSMHSFAYSGWEGILPKELAARIQEHGIISKATQTAQGCGGLYKYPLFSFDPSNDMGLEEYHSKAELIDDLSHFETTNLLDIYQFLLNENPKINSLNEVKESLEDGDRLVMATVLIADKNLSLWGKHHVENDTWVYLPEFKDGLEKYDNISAHELVITGYDDNAVAIDEDGVEHKGLLILRNSWGPNVGDHGNFYMAYDYFNAFAFDILRIRNLFI